MPRYSFIPGIAMLVTGPFAGTTVGAATADAARPTVATQIAAALMTKPRTKPKFFFPCFAFSRAPEQAPPRPRPRGVGMRVIVASHRVRQGRAGGRWEK